MSRTLEEAYLAPMEPAEVACLFPESLSGAMAAVINCMTSVQDDTFSLGPVIDGQIVLQRCLSASMFKTGCEGQKPDVIWVSGSTEGMYDEMCIAEMVLFDQTTVDMFTDILPVQLVAYFGYYEDIDHESL